MHITRLSLLLAATAILSVTAAPLPPSGGPVHLFKRNSPSPYIGDGEGLARALAGDGPAIFAAWLCVQEGIEKLPGRTTESARQELYEYREGRITDNSLLAEIEKIAQDCVATQLKSEVAKIEGGRAGMIRERPTVNEDSGRANPFMQSVRSLPELARTAIGYMHPSHSYYGQGGAVVPASGLRAMSAGWR